MPVQSFRSSIAMNRTFGFVSVVFAACIAAEGNRMHRSGNIASSFLVSDIDVPVRFGFHFLLQQRVLIAFSTCSVRWIRYAQSFSLSCGHDPSEQVVSDLLHALIGPLLSHSMTARIQVPGRT